MSGMSVIRIDLIGCPVHWVAGGYEIIVDRDVPFAWVRACFARAGLMLDG